MMSGSQLHQVRIRSVSLFALRMCERHEKIAGGTHHRWRQRAEPQSMRRRLNIHVLAAYALVTLALAYFGVMASRHIALPGLNVDEVLGVRPAVGGPVARRIFGIPVLTISYIGALKSYIYFPIFALFGGSPETIRLPTIFISLLTLALTFKLSRLHFRPSYSALLVLLMAADPIFIFMSKADYGPIVLMMFFKMLALYFFFRFIATSSPRYLWGVAISCGLGLFDKFNFMWFVLALVVAAVVVFRHELRSAVAQSRSQFIWPLGALLVALAVTARYSMPLFLQTHSRAVSASSSVTSDPLGRIQFVSDLYLQTMNSRDQWFMQRSARMGTITNWITLPIIGLVVLAATARLLRRRQSPIAQFIDRVGLFYLLIFVAILVQIVLTTAADGPYHIMMLYPFHYILMVSVANRLSGLRLGGVRSDQSADGVHSPSSRRRFGRSELCSPRLALVLGVVSVAALLVASEVRVGVHYQQAIDDQAFSFVWTPAIYKLSAYLDRREVQRNADAIISANWGMHNQVFVLSRSGDRSKYTDLSREFTELDNPQQGKSLAEEFFAGKRVLVLAYPEGLGDRTTAATRDHFLSFAKYYFGGTRLERVVTNDRGEAMFAIYYVDARARR